MKRLIALSKALARSFSRRERFIIACMVLCAGVSGTFVGARVIRVHTQTIPTYGGTYTEGVIGQPSFINPILAPQSDLVTLLFANINDLAESVTHDDQFKTWTVRIKENAQWHDGTPITSDDIIFTIALIQNADTLSPLFSEWQGIMPTRVSEREVRFNSASSYAPFQSLLLNNLRPIPKKLFADIAPANIRLSQYNSEPIGSGPFKFISLEKRKDAFVTSYTLQSNPAFEKIEKAPYIKAIVIKFFENEDELIRAYNKGLLDGFGGVDKKTTEKTTISTGIIKAPTTKQYVLFINPNAYAPLAQTAFRQALAYATNKKDIIETVYGDAALEAHGPIPPTLDTYNKAIEENDTYNPQQAQTVIEQMGWTKNADGWFEKKDKSGTQELLITIKTPDIFGLKEIADAIKVQWERIGIKTTVVLIDPQNIAEDVIKTRDYQLLLFGSTVATQPELFSFWHSSEKFAPGLNLSLYENSAVDTRLTALRKSPPDSTQRKQTLNEIQQLVSHDVPALFITSPLYIYAHRSSIDGIVMGTIAIPSDRFASSTYWYLKTKRIFK